MVIVAEQHDTARASLADLFRGNGYQVLEADNSNSVISCINKTPDISAVLTDLEMPGWPRIIKHARDVRPNACVLGMVRYLSLPNVVEAQCLGLHNYFVKPVVFADLHEKIALHLARQSSR